MKLRPVVCFTLLFLLFLTSASCYARTFYIKWDSTGPFTGESWDTAFRKPTEVFGAAVEGDEILVAAGEYVMGVTVKSGVALRGGYSGNGLERDPRRFPTTLTGSTTSICVLQTPAGCPASTVIEGFVIRGYKWYGGIAAYGSPTISNNLIYGNVNEMYVDWGGSYPTVINGRGGGIYCDGGSATIISNVIVGNTATGRESGENKNGGGGIYCATNASPLIANNVIAGNSGGGIVGGGAGSNCTIINNTIADNEGYGIGRLDSSSQVVNNVIAYNTKGVYCSGTTPVLGYDCVYGNTTNFEGITDPTGTNGNISTDPMLANYTGGNVHLRLGSPCIGAGDNSVVQAGWVDLDGQARVQPVGGTVDIGVDESDATDPGTATKIIHVSPNGNDTNDGSTWLMAKRSIQAAIDSQTDGCEIWTAAGTYIGNIATRAYSYLYGGFDGTESARSQRDIAANRSLIGGSVAIYGGRDRVVFDGFDVSHERAGDGITCIFTSASVQNNSISAPVSCYGSQCTVANNVIASGGIKCSALPGVSYSTPLIANNTITGAYIGIEYDSPTPVIVNNIVAYCVTGLRKGASILDPTLRNNCFYGNTADFEGITTPPIGTNGNISADPRLTSIPYRDSHIQPGSPCINAGDNSVVQPGWKDRDGLDRIYPTGGTVDIGAFESDGRTWTAASPAVVRVSPGGNDANDGSSWALAKRTIQAGIDEASRQVGEVWVKSGTYTGSLSLSPFAYVYGGFDGTEIQRSERDSRLNKTIMDGRFTTPKTELTASYIGEDMSAIEGFTLRGISVTFSYCSPKILRCNCRSSSITCNYSDSTIAYSFLTGTRIDLTYSAGLIANNTITAVGTRNASAGRSITSNYSTPTIVNNIIAFSPGSAVAKTDGNGNGYWPILHHNCIYGQSIPFLDPGPGGIGVDPKLANVDYGETHIQSGSPCIDAGDDSLVESGALDIDGQSRITGAHVDIGADEYDGTVWPTAPQVVRVTPTGNDANNGSSWSQAKRTLSAAVEAASLDGGDVWVKTGAYNGSVVVQQFTYLYGGFAGTETSRDQRDSASHSSVLDGQAAGSVVTMTGAGLYNGIDGFTIRNGAGNGAGILCASGASGTIANNIITANGGASSTYGGGIYCSSSSPLITGNTISSNTATSGAGIYLTYCTAIVEGNTLISNSSLSGSTSAGIHADSSSSNSPIRSNIIINHTNAGGTAAGIYLESGLKVTNNVIVGNDRGVYFKTSNFLRNNIIAYNGTGIYKSSGTPTLTNNDVFGNTTNYYGCTAGAGDISLDPLFVNRAANDLHLRAGSPCIDAGIATDAPITDRDGVYRPQDGDGNGVAAFDIGAYEYKFNLSGALHDRADGSAIAFPGVSVTACFPSDGCIYVETADRIFGIRVDTTETFNEGDVVTVAGTLQTDTVTGERYVQATAPSPDAMGVTALIKPYAMAAKALGGASIGLQGGITDSVYLNNIALLVTTWGTIVRDGGNVYLSDGSGSQVKLILPSGVTIDAGSTFAAVTGISSSEAVGSITIPVLKVRKQADIVQN